MSVLQPTPSSGPAFRIFDGESEGDAVAVAIFVTRPCRLTVSVVSEAEVSRYRRANRPGGAYERAGVLLWIEETEHYEEFAAVLE